MWSCHENKIGGRAGRQDTSENLLSAQILFYQAHSGVADKFWFLSRPGWSWSRNMFRQDRLPYWQVQIKMHVTSLWS